MNLSLLLPRSIRVPLLYAGVAAVFALGCSGPSVPVHTDVAVEATSCVEGALSMTFTVASTNGLFPPTYQYGSGNVVGMPTIVPGTNSFHVTASLDTVAAGEAVSMNFGTSVFQPATIGAQNVQFYTVPVAQLPSPPGCPPEDGPVIGTADGPGLGLHLEVSNPTPDPIMLEQLELAETSSLLSSFELAWGSSALESLSWTNPFGGGGIVLAPGSPPLVIDLPDFPSPGTVGSLLRYASTSGGQHHRAIVQADLVGGPVKAEPTTWGAVKALYRKD